MAADDRVNEFDPDNVETISAWVLEYPFLQWVPSSKSYPQLEVRVSSSDVRQLSVRGVLGRGAFGIVLLCVDRENRIAVKIPRLGSSTHLSITDIGPRLDRELPDDPDGVDKTFKRRVDAQKASLIAGFSGSSLAQMLETFRSETSMLARLKNPCIVALEFSGEIVAGESTGGDQKTLPCIAMPYVQGVRLSEFINDEKIWDLEKDFLHVLKTARDLALALACIHDRRTCHRDLSWFNVMMSSERRPVIIDLGNVSLPEAPVSPQIHDTITGGVSTQFIPFTPGFVAPEHRDGTTVIDGRGDQFSLGVILYLWCSGKKNKEPRWPFDKTSGKSNNPTDTQAPISLTELRRGFIASWKEPLQTSFRMFSDVVQRMVKWQREDRYSSLRDVAAEMEVIIQHLDPKYAVALPVEEITIDNMFDELCRQVSIKPDESAGCLILQTLVRQARQQIGEAINRIWDAVFETWTDSTLAPSPKSLRMFEQGRSLESDFKTSMNVILRTFQKTKMTGTAVARFGGRFQQILGHSAPHTTLRRPPAFSDEASHLEYVVSLWDYFNERQERLANTDMQLSTYSLRLKALYGSRGTQ